MSDKTSIDYRKVLDERFSDGEAAVYAAEKQEDWRHVEITDQLVDAVEECCDPGTIKRIKMFKQQYGQYPAVTISGGKLNFQKTINRRQVKLRYSDSDSASDEPDNLSNDFIEFRKAVRRRFNKIPESELKIVKTRSDISRLMKRIKREFDLMDTTERIAIGTIVGATLLVGGIVVAVVASYNDCLEEARTILEASNDFSQIDNYGKSVGCHATISYYNGASHATLVPNKSTKAAAEEFTQRLIKVLKKKNNGYVDDETISKSELLDACEVVLDKVTANDSHTRISVVDTSRGKVTLKIVTNAKSDTNSKTAYVDISLRAFANYSNIPGVTFSWGENYKLDYRKILFS